MADWTDRLREAVVKAQALEKQLADPSAADYATLAKQLGEIRPLASAAERYMKLQQDMHDAKEMLEEEDLDLRELAQDELQALDVKRGNLELEIRQLLVPKDPNDVRDVIIEIRAGAGGEEAALFASDLFRMYSRYSEARGWKLETLASSISANGGFKEVIAALSGKRVFGDLKHERGVHRVQRVPSTESQGRIHTSTVTVAVLPQAEDVDVEMDAKDLRVDVYRSSGPGGQSVNTTDSAVRITHEPTGIVVQCQDEKSQHKNKARAMKVLRARLMESQRQKLAAERARDRKTQVGSGDRSEKIRTYNFPQSRVTDHRTGLTLHRLDQILEGDLAELIKAVNDHVTAEIEDGVAGVAV